MYECFESIVMIDREKYAFQNPYFFILLQNKKTDTFVSVFIVVEVTGFEPAASWSQTKRSTKLSHTSMFVSADNVYYYICS